MSDWKQKYRAWDGVRMVFFDTLQIGIGKNHKRGKRDTEPYVFFLNDTFCGEVRLGQHEVMLSTPFTDCKGVHVYEGDYIEDTVVGLKSEVVFTDYGNIGLKPLPGQLEMKDLEYEIIDPAWMSTSAIIVGNKYQN